MSPAGKILALVIALILVGLTAHGLIGSGSGSSEAQEHAEIESPSYEVVAGSCVNAGPETTKAIYEVLEVVDCNSRAAWGRITPVDLSTCGPGYVSPEGAIMNVANVEGETVCIEDYLEHNFGG